MDFKYSEEDEAFRHELRSWLEANVPKDWRDDGELADPDTKTEFERRRGWHRQLYDAGWMCIHWPKEYGGRGATILQQLVSAMLRDEQAAVAVDGHALAIADSGGITLCCRESLIEFIGVVAPNAAARLFFNAGLAAGR